MQSKDIALELLEEEWEKRRKKIIETRKIDPEDTMILSIIRLNHEVREIMDKMATKDDIKNMATKDDIKNMATKDDIKILKNDIKMLKWFISIGFTIIGILIAIFGILK
jgi:hypothetical protein